MFVQMHLHPARQRHTAQHLCNQLAKLPPLPKAEANPCLDGRDTTAPVRDTWGPCTVWVLPRSWILWQKNPKPVGTVTSLGTALLCWRGSVPCLSPQMGSLLSHSPVRGPRELRAWLASGDPRSSAVLPGPCTITHSAPQCISDRISCLIWQQN